uniref:Putative RxLR effector n=1 Tax=Plasmopara viticola TaxID=143451 RepID=A0A650F572_PLAVT|nr:putative RxLR effector [Plasmopara viticola]
MRGAFYVTTALLITNSIRTAAEADRSEYRQRSYHVGVAPGSMDTKSSPTRFLRGSHEQHDDFIVSAADEERMPEASARIIGNSLTSVSEEVTGTMRKAAHLDFDLNAPPKETVTGALEAYNILRNKEPRSYTAVNAEVSNSHLSNKRTAEALTSLDKASGFAISKPLSGGQPKKKLRTKAPVRGTKVQSGIGHDKMTLVPRPLSEDDVQNVHKLYLKHLSRSSAKFEPTEGETRKMLGLINDTGNARPSLAKTYAPYVEELMKMNLEKMKELGLDPKTVLKPSLMELLERPSEDLREIQLCLLRLLRLKRWMRMYRNFFDFCLSRPEVCSNLSAASTLQIELKLMAEYKPSFEVASHIAVLEPEEIESTKAEREMLKRVARAIKKSNLKETAKATMYKIVGEIYRDDVHLTSLDLSAFSAGTLNIKTGKRRTYLSSDVLKTPSRFGRNEESLSGERSRDRKAITKLIEKAVNRMETTKRYDQSVKGEDEVAKLTEIRTAFIKDSHLGNELTLEMIRKMVRFSNWVEGSSDPYIVSRPGQMLKDYVAGMKIKDLETELGSNWEEFKKKTLEHLSAVQKEPKLSLLELQTDYLLMLLEAYDKFYPFCVRNPFLCKESITQRL